LDGTRVIVVATSSESLFERYCQLNDIPWMRIGEARHRMPDYAIRLRTCEVVCEVKQLDMGKREKAAWTQALKEGAGTYAVQNRLRQTLKDVSAQLKSSSAQGTPTILAVVDNTPFHAELEHEMVVQALYGTIGRRVLISEDSEPALGDPFLGGNRGFTPTQNTAVSALAVLEELGSGLRLRIYHNLHAAVPLDPQLFEGLPADQRILPGDTSIEVEA
jgi:hypothetical protein